MDCPKCQKGKLRVMTTYVCMCGHHQLLCDACFQFYDNDHFPTMTAVDDLRETHQLMAAEHPDLVTQTFDEIMRESIAENPEGFPLFEGSKKEDA